MVRVIEKRESQEKPNDLRHVEYYVHYEAFNRRLDTWVSLIDFDLSTVEIVEKRSGAAGEKDHKDDDPKRKRQKKGDDGVAAENKHASGGHGNAHAADPEHAEFDPRGVTRARGVYQS